MILELKLRKFGNSLGVILPREALARLEVEEGDRLFLTETTERGYRLTSGNPEFARKIEAAGKLSRQYRGEDGLVIHEMLLARHGGRAGVRDEALLESALAKPRERFAKGGAKLSALAAVYASAIAVSRPFASGNTCTAFLIAATFLRINGLVFTGKEMQVVEETLALARGDSSESFYATFLQCNSRAA
jgi:death-on-curing protein